MERHPPEILPYVEIVHKLDQAVFFCYNESAERLPVGMVNGFTFNNNSTLSFRISYFPPTEQVWDIFAAELYFYKKGIPYSVILHGVAIVNDIENHLVQFSIENAEYFGLEDDITTDRDFLSSLFKPYIYFYRKSSALLSQSLFKKSIANTPGTFSPMRT